MKNIITISIAAFIWVSIFFSSCCCQKPLASDMAKFSIKGDSIFYEGKHVATFLNLEWEYYRGHKTMEISVGQVGDGANQMTDKIVDFIRTKHPKAKAEVKIPYKSQY